MSGMMRRRTSTVRQRSTSWRTIGDPLRVATITSSMLRLLTRFGTDARSPRTGRPASLRPLSNRELADEADDVGSARTVVEVAGKIHGRLAGSDDQNPRTGCDLNAAGAVEGEETGSETNRSHQGQGQEATEGQ